MTRKFKGGYAYVTRELESRKGKRPCIEIPNRDVEPHFLAAQRSMTMTDQMWAYEENSVLIASSLG